MLNRDRIKANISANNWRDVVKLGGNLLVKNGNIRHGYIDSMIETVERLGPYMILLPKVAFFHGPPSEDVIEPGISLVVLNKPVYFSEFEDEEIRCAFSFCATDSDSHLGLLTKFATLLQNEELIDAITSNANEEAILKLMEDKEDDL